MARHIGGAFRLHGIHAVKPALLGRYAAEYQILSRNVEVKFLVDIIARLGMAHQRDAVRPAPVGKLTVIGGIEALHNHPPVQRNAGIFLAHKPRVEKDRLSFIEEAALLLVLPGKQAAQILQFASRGRKVPFKAVGPFQQAAFAASQHARLVREEAADHRAEIFGQLFIISIVREMDELCDSLGIEQIRRGRSVRFAVVLPVMDAADGPAAGPLDNAETVVEPHKHLAGFGISLFQRDTAGRKFRVAAHYLAVRRTGGVHRLVVQDDGHIQSGSRFHDRADDREIFV